MEDTTPWKSSRDVNSRSKLLGSLLTYSLLETLFAHDAFGSEVRPQTVEWLAHVNPLGRRRTAAEAAAA